MKFKIAALLASTIFLASCSQEKNNIATADIDSIVKSPVCETPMQNLEKEYEPKFMALEKQAKDLSSDKNSKDDDKIKQIQFEYQQLQQKAQSQAQALQLACIDKVKAEAKNIAIAKGYNFVIPSSYTLYSPDTVDITEEIKSALNAGKNSNTTPTDK